MRKQFIWMMRAVLILMALGGAVASLLIAPHAGLNFKEALPECAYLYWPCLLYIWGLFVLYYIGLWNGWKVMDDIAADRSFSGENVRRLMLIAKLALCCSVLIVVGTVLLMTQGLMHPMVLLLLTGAAGAGLIITVVASSLSHLAEKASKLQDDSDLTI